LPRWSYTEDRRASNDIHLTFTVRPVPMRIHHAHRGVLNVLGIVVVLLRSLLSPTRTSAAVAEDVDRIDEWVAHNDVQESKKAGTGFAWDGQGRRPRGNGRSLLRQSIVGGSLTQGQEFPFFVEGNVRCRVAAT
jgi:hypothetical protein